MVCSFFICHDAAVLHSGTDLPGQRRTARNAQRHKHTRQLHHIAAGQLDAGDFLLAEDGVEFFQVGQSPPAETLPPAAHHSAGG